MLLFNRLSAKWECLHLIFYNQFLRESLSHQRQIALQQRQITRRKKRMAGNMESLNLQTSNRKRRVWDRLWIEIIWKRMIKEIALKYSKTSNLSKKVLSSWPRTKWSSIWKIFHKSSPSPSRSETCWKPVLLERSHQYAQVCQLPSRNSKASLRLVRKSPLKKCKEHLPSRRKKKKSS